MEYRIKEEYKGLSITKTKMGVGTVTLNTNKDYTPTQLKNFFPLFEGVIEKTGEEKTETNESNKQIKDKKQYIYIEEGKELPTNYFQLLKLAKDLGFEYDKNPKKEKLIEDIESKI